MLQPEFIQARGKGVNISLAVWKGGEHPMLCIHGITANCREWDVMAPALTDSHKLFAMDLRGRGGSDRPESGYSIRYHIQDIISLLDDLGIKRCSIMGHSLGAFITLAFAAQYPKRIERIVLVDGGGDLSPEQMQHVFAGIKPSLSRLGQVFPSVRHYLSAMRQSPCFDWSTAYEAYFRHELEETEGGVRCNIRPEHILEESANLCRFKCSDFYTQIECPTLILKATDGLITQDDLLLPKDVIKRMLNAIPKAECFEVAGTNHYGIVFQPHHARDQAVVNFLNRSTQGNSS
jgi:pimeloyl-ACP methyl ester carboxylesterase